MTRWEKLKLTWQLRQTHLMVNAWGLCFGLLAVVTSFFFFADPHALLHASNVGLSLQHHIAIVYAWNVLYGIGGLGMLVGLITLKPEIDVAGLCCFAGASIMQTIGVIEIWPSLHWLGIFMYGCLAIAALLRANAILRAGGFN